MIIFVLGLAWWLLLPDGVSHPIAVMHHPFTRLPHFYSLFTTLSQVSRRWGRSWSPSCRPRSCPWRCSRLGSDRMLLTSPLGMRLITGLVCVPQLLGSKGRGVWSLRSLRSLGSLRSLCSLIHLPPPSSHRAHLSSTGRLHWFSTDSCVQCASLPGLLLSFS